MDVNGLACMISLLIGFFMGELAGTIYVKREITDLENKYIDLINELADKYEQMLEEAYK